MTDKCIVCGNKKVKAVTRKCKLCGMGLSEDGCVKENDLVFCCEKCRDRFKIILENASEKEKEKLLQKNIII